MIMVNLTTAEDTTIITERPFINMNNVTLIELPSLLPNNNYDNITLEEFTTISTLDNLTTIYTEHDNITDNSFSTTTAYPTFEGVDYQQSKFQYLFIFSSF